MDSDFTDSTPTPRCGYPELHIFRPGPLTGPRRENRPGERVGILFTRLLTPVLVGGLRRFRPIHLRTVAAAGVGAARAGVPGRHVYTYDDMVRLAR